MCRTVTDAAILLGALAGADPADSATAAAPASVPPPDYTKALDPNGLKGARIGVVRGAFGSPEGDRLVNAALDVLKAQGATLVDPVEIPHMKDYGDQEFTVLLYELKADLNTYLAGLGSATRMKTLADVIAFNDAHKETEMPYFGQETFIQAQEKGPLTDDAYIEALAHCRRLSRAEAVDRGDAHQVRVRVRASREAAAGAALLAYRGPLETVRISVAVRPRRSSARRDCAPPA